MAKFIYLEKKLTNQNCLLEEIWNKFNMENGSYCSVHKPFDLVCLSKDEYSKLYRIII